MIDPRHLFLVGFMGAGKSTVGRLVSAHMGRPFIDLDELVERAARMPVTQIFAEKGEDAFRALETEALRGLSSAEPAVVACGGGVVLSPENRALLKRLGRVVYLQVTAGEALARIGDAGTRPLLAGPGGALAATSLLSAREALYRSVADSTVETTGRTAEQVANQITSTEGVAR
ncbi:MAG TPA: shikimate kinase [Coriobacteriia bacterium]|nr:shikimate kinase [Coriobacteriia bacterium]